MALIQMRAPEGRPWKLKEWVQGKPLGVPTHSMVVHFPVAFYLGVIVFDVMSRITPNEGLVLASTYMLLLGLLGTLVAAPLGLIDWLGMVKGSSKRRLATRHMVFQLLAAAFFIVAFVLRWPDRTASQAEISWIVIEAVGYLVLIVGQHLGGTLVYQKAMRVSTGGPDRE
ncbi:MAG TPA: DUF2231 domain-containing protein [Actinomycetota bacterium]